VRRSASSIQTSNKLAVATSLCSSQSMRLAQVRRQLFVVIAQFGEHIHRRNEIRIIVRNALQAADVADRMQSRAADLANTFSDHIGSGEDLVAVLIQQKMTVMKVCTRHVPMKVFRLHIQSEHVGEQDIQRGSVRVRFSPAGDVRFSSLKPIPVSIMVKLIGLAIPSSSISDSRSISIVSEWPLPPPSSMACKALWIAS
jgi:hypothetical protein